MQKELILDIQMMSCEFCKIFKRTSSELLMYVQFTSCVQEEDSLKIHFNQPLFAKFTEQKILENLKNSDYVH